MIRVLNIQESITFGGVERRRLSLSKLLDKSKFELKIVCTHYRGGIVEEIRANNVEVIAIGKLTSPFDYKQHQKVLKIIKEFKPHIIHGAVFEGVTMASINGFLKRVPIVIIEETSDPQNRSWKGNLLMKIFSKIADKCIGVSPASTHYLTNTLGISTNKVILINNGVEIPQILTEVERQKLRSHYSIDQDEIVIGTVGRMLLEEHKRFSDLINAFKLVVKKGIKAKLILVGDGPEKMNYEKLVGELKIQGQVIFVGYQAKVSDFYSIFDIFSLVSAYEAFGLVLAEAMLHKLPVVATRVGGMQYIVDDNQTGFLVEKFDVQRIADKLETLCCNEIVRKKYGQKGFDKAMSDFTEERYVKELENLYLDLCKQKKLL